MARAQALLRLAAALCLLALARAGGRPARFLAERPPAAEGSPTAEVRRRGPCCAGLLLLSLGLLACRLA